MTYDGQDQFIAKDPVARSYYRLSLIQYRILELLKQEQSWETLIDTLHAEFREDQLTLALLERTLFDLQQKGLIYSIRPGLTDIPTARSTEPLWMKWRRLPMNIMFIKLPPINVEWLLRIVQPMTSWIFSPLAVVVSTLMMFCSGLFLLTHFHEFQSQLPTVQEMLNWQNLILWWLVIGAAKGVHELAHAIACRRYGGECNEIGMAFLIFSPCLYCDVSDSWMFAKKHQRIFVALAGIWIELIIACVCFCLWWNSSPGLFHIICLQLMVATSVSTILFNANPLLRYDGYYIFSDLLEIPNLQQRGREAVDQTFSYLLFGMKPPENTIRSPKKFWLCVLYGICSGLYRWIILFGIGAFLYYTLKPYGLQTLGVLYICLSICASLIVLGMMFGKIMMNLVRSNHPRAILRAIPGIVVMAAGGMALWHAPLKDHSMAPVIIQPHQLQHVYADVSGELTAIHVEPGDKVEAGELIAELQNIDLQQRLVTLQGESQRQQVDLALATALGNPDLHELVETEIQTVSLRREALEEENNLLNIEAPCSGRIVSAPKSSPSSKGTNRRWPGSAYSPLDNRQLHAFIPERTLLCSVAPNNQWEAVAWVQQDEIPLLSPEEPVEVLLDCRPEHRCKARILSVSHIKEDGIPAQLTQKHGGSISTRQSTSGEVPLKAIYRVTILIEPTEVEFCLGMTGSMRFLRSKQTVGEWFNHKLHQTFMNL